MYRRSAVNRRPLVAGALAALAVTTTGLLSACGTGQIAQTAAVQPGVAGVNTQAPDRLVFIRNAALEYPGKDGYQKGGDAPLALWIFNDTESPVTLVGVFGAPDQPALTIVESDGANTAAPCSAQRSASPSVAAPTESATASPSPDKSAKSSTPAKGSPSPSTSSASPSPAPSPSPTVGSSTINVKIPAGGCVELSKRAASYLQIVGLPQAVRNEDSVPVIFVFASGDGKHFTIGTPGKEVQVPITTPESPQPRTSG
jgi:hypothetical protein